MNNHNALSHTIFFIIATVCVEAFATEETELKELLNLDITQLKTVSIASKKNENLLDATAAVYVITQDDIRRSGLNSVPELLRLVPGLQVASLRSNIWAISSRDVNERFARKLLVMIDGRTVYTPLFAGVYWDVQNLMLEDIDRIEIIRGPGGTLWGENAVNGVINILTKHARDTQGGLLSAGAGNEENGFVDLRYGWSNGEETYARAYAKYFDRDDFEEADGSAGPDDWDSGQIGFRLDHVLSESDSLLVKGDYYDGDSGQELTDLVSLAPITFDTYREDANVSGGNLLAKWTHITTNNAEMILQAYFDNAEREETRFDQAINTLDIDFQHRFPIGASQEFMWGLAHRSIFSDLRSGFVASFDPESEWNQISSIFLQDDIWLKADYLKLTLGSKFSYNSFSGFEYQPNARLLWKIRPNQSLWAAVSRAVRTPAISSDTFRFNASAIPGPILFSVFGNDTESEELLAYEIGYRAQPARRLSFDIAAFYNDYDNLFTREEGAPFIEATPPPVHTVIPTIIDNKMSGEIYGVELSTTWQVTDWWSLQAWLAMQKILLHLDGSHFNTLESFDTLEGDSPELKFHVRSYLDLPHNLDLDTFLYYVDNVPNQDVPDYLRLDMRLAWQPINDIEISLVGQNLLDPEHPEIGSDFAGVTTTEVERSFYVKIIWIF